MPLSGRMCKTVDSHKLPIVLALGHRFASLDAERAVLAGVAEVVDGNALQGADLAAAQRAARVVLLGTRARLDAAALAALPSCRGIVRYGIGVDNIDVERATALGIAVANVPDYCIAEVSDHTVALALAASRRLIASHEAARQGRWGTDVMQGTARLGTQTMGIVGFGRIGQETARKVRALVARVLVYDPFVPAGRVQQAGAVPADLDTLLAEADIVAVNCPLTAATRHLINATTLASMKPTAWLINTARGEIVNEDDLVAALREGRIGGAALDVLAAEPPPSDAPLLHMANAIVTSHVAWYSQDALRDLQRRAAEQARDLLLGRPVPGLLNEPGWPS